VENQEAATSAESGRRLRLTTWDMVRSLAVVLALVAAVLIVTWRPQPEPIKIVDPAGMFAVASQQAPFEVLVADLPGLRTTSVRWEPTEATGDEPAWHIGSLTPDAEYLQVAQALGGGADFIAEQTQDGVDAGQSIIDGRTWSRLESPNSRSLVLSGSDAVTIVSGTGDWAQLEQAVRSLTSQPRFGQ
jgi:hypothetical protein